MSAQKIESLPLHDAVLDSINLSLEKKLCRFYLHAFSIPGKTAIPHALEFEAVELVNAPLTDPWGPSPHINTVSQSAEGFLIEMQSGDTIKVKARSFSFIPL